MAQITINIQDARLQDLVDYIAKAKQYTGFDRNGNAETKNQFARRMVIEQLRSWWLIGRRMDLEEQIATNIVADQLGIS